MLRAIVWIAVAEAACLGEYRATFRGFRVHAWRFGQLSAGPVMSVTVETRCEGSLFERGIVDVSSGWFTGY